MKHQSQYSAIQSHSLHISIGTFWSLNQQQIITIYKPYKTQVCIFKVSII